MRAPAPLKIFNSLMNVPSPSSLTYLWNGGSLLGLCLATQLISGIFLAMHYSCDVSLAFDSVSHIMRDVNLGWALRMAHANVASLFFMFLYIHISRGLYFGSFGFTLVWVSGVLMLFLVMGTAFLGYVLPWGQMSFWGATVITSLASAIPVLGEEIVLWLWGGFSISNATLTRFFTLHFLLPFILTALAVSHMVFLHETGSSNPLGVNSNFDKTSFAPYFTVKDLLGALVMFIALILLMGINPWAMGDPENFIPANPLVTPQHIQPEWYFLFAYAVLRSIPNKLGGVVGLVLSVAILTAAPFVSKDNLKSLSFAPFKKCMFWCFVFSVILLTWIGARPVEDPYVITGQCITILYFIFFLLLLYIKCLKLSEFFDSKYMSLTLMITHIYLWCSMAVTALGLSSFLVFLGWPLAKKTTLSLAHSSPFECGFTPLSEMKTPISVHFFILGLVFLIFDTELILLFPYFLSNSVDNLSSYLVLFTILNFLSLGLFYEWVTSMLEWLS